MLKLAVTQYELLITLVSGKNTNSLCRCWVQLTIGLLLTISDALLVINLSYSVLEYLPRVCEPSIFSELILQAQ